jgi:hypothetical protein
MMRRLPHAAARRLQTAIVERLRDRARRQASAGVRCHGAAQRLRIGVCRSALALADRSLKVGIAERLALSALKPPEPKLEARRPWRRRLHMTG